MPKAANAKSWSLQSHPDGTRRSYAYVPPASPGGPPSLSLAAINGSTVGLNITAVPQAARSVISYQVERSLDQTIWFSVATLEAAAPSIIPARDVRTPTKYVHPSGSVNGNFAYTTIEAADAAAVPGDVIAVGGSWNNRAVIQKSGTPGAGRIYWRPVDYDNPPTLDGQTTVNPPGWNGGRGTAHLLAVQANYVTVDGFRAQNSNSNGIGIGNCDNNGSYIPASATSTWYVGIEIYRCVVKNVKGTALTTLMAQDYIVAGNDFSEYRFSTYWDQSAGNPPLQYGSLINIGGRNGTFVENDVHESIGEGIHIGAHINMMEFGQTPRGTGAKGFKVNRNRVWDCWAPGIYVTVGQDGEVDGNTVFATDDDRFWFGRSRTSGQPQYGIVIGSELGAFGNPTAVFDDVYSGVARVKVRNNIINGHSELFKVVRYSDDSNYEDIEIDHNTIFCPSGAFASVYSALVNGCNSTNVMTGFKVRNNAVAVSDASDITTEWNALGSGKVVQGNFFSHSPPSDLAAASNIVSASATVLADQNYKITGVYWPSPKTFDVSKAAPYYSGGVISPLVNAVDSVGVLTDFYGRTRPTGSGKVDIGAISLSKTLTPSYQDTGRTAGVPYFYRARYVQSDGTVSAWSPVQGVTL